MSDLHVHPSMPPAVAAPDWQFVTDEVECVRCGYNLRGLTQPRCPECGLEFEWADLLDPTRRQHPYLFEHQAQHGPIASYMRTALGSLKPPRFWRTITIQQPCHGRRLWLYALIFVGLYGFIAGGVSALVLALLGIRWFGGMFIIRSGVSPPLVVILLLPLVIQLATIGALLVFQQSLSRWRIRSYHVTRVCVYSAVGLYIGMGVILLLWLAFLINSFQFLVPRTSILWSLAVGVFVMVMILTALHWWVSLWCAYRRYLKIRRAAAMLVASQIIAALVVINVYVFAF